MRLVEDIVHDIDIDEVWVDPTEPDGGLVHFKRFTEDGGWRYIGYAQYTIHGRAYWRGRQG